VATREDSGVVLLIFALVGRHVTSAAVWAVIVTLAVPHVLPLVSATFAAVEVSKEHGLPHERLPGVTQGVGADSAVADAGHFLGRRPPVQ
jgi:hypothetical protein